ncbi:MAG: hypothetical protein LC623_02795 [Halobacteriales archaeon]|nr:hypothetical protein [Halobacteriales archaeon]
MTSLANLLWALRWRSRRERFAALQRDFEAQRHEKVPAAAQPFLRSRRHRWDAGSMAIVSLAHLGRDGEARQLLARLERLPEAQPAALDYLAACIAASRGDHSEASRLLGTAIDEQKEAARRARRGPGDGYT